MHFFVSLKLVGEKTTMHFKRPQFKTDKYKCENTKCLSSDESCPQARTTLYIMPVVKDDLRNRICGRCSQERDYATLYRFTRNIIQEHWYCIIKCYNNEKLAV